MLSNHGPTLLKVQPQRLAYGNLPISAYSGWVQETMQMGPVIISDFTPWQFERRPSGYADPENQYTASPRRQHTLKRIQKVGAMLDILREVRATARKESQPDTKRDPPKTVNKKTGRPAQGGEHTVSNEKMRQLCHTLNDMVGMDLGDKWQLLAAPWVAILKCKLRHLQALDEAQLSLEQDIAMLVPLDCLKIYPECLEQPDQTADIMRSEIKHHIAQSTGQVRYLKLLIAEFDNRVKAKLREYLREDKSCREIQA
ncbi:hypothetical protein NUW58_g626 [Xylaria curta]|uniref:Uncharacterized protein n=1 Tax=Xylaria curta TaxID=42375 RepID=A0ACC1PNN7_9PEZI|nr:hypothetical protein NUW58_g626 [Xylaria curta]